MPFLPPNQWRQSTAGKSTGGRIINVKKTLFLSVMFNMDEICCVLQFFSFPSNQQQRQWWITALH